ncbi:MAG: cell division protein FtsQ/DivIB [Pseudomonadota bacterium]
MRPLAGARPGFDPAPSRWGYRLQRLWLTPLFRALLRTGVPAFAVVAGVTLYINQPHVRQNMALGVVEARAWVQERPEFMVNLMAVNGASAEVSDTVRAALHLDLPASSFDLDLDALRAQVESLAPVQDATLRIRPGGVLEIGLVERVPALVWRGPDGLSLLDIDGVSVASLDARSDRADLPLVVGAGADEHVTEALDLLRAAAPIAPRMRGLSRVGQRRWDVILDRGQVIQLPEDGALAALERVILLDTAQDLLARDITHIDLRNPHRPTLRLAEHGLSELRRIKGIEIGGFGNE